MIRTPRMLLLPVLVGLLATSSTAVADVAEELEWALAELDAGEVDDATDRLRTALESEPDHRGVRLWLARALGRRGDYRRSHDHYRSLLETDPTDVEARIGLADVLAWQADYTEAEEVLRSLAVERRRDPEVWRRRGSVALWRGDRDRAIEYYSRALALDPDHEDATRGLIQALAPRPRTRLSVAEVGASALRAGSGYHASEEWIALGADGARWSVHGRARSYSRFDLQDFRGEAEVAYRWRGRSLRLEGGLAPGAELLARTSGEIELGWPLAPGVVAYLGGKRSSYLTVTTTRGTTGLELYVTHRLALYGRYSRTDSAFDDGGAASDGAWHARVTNFFPGGQRVWAFVSSGSESYQNPSLVIGSQAAHGAGVGARVRPALSWEFDAVIERQVWRGGETHLTLTGAVRRRY